MIRLLLRNRGVEESDKTFMKAVDKSIMTTPTGQFWRRGRMWVHRLLNCLSKGPQGSKRRCQHHKPSLDMDVNETGRHAVWSRDYRRPEQPVTAASCFKAGNTHTHGLIVAVTELLMPLPSIHTRAAMAATITRCSLATIKLLPRHNPIMVRRIMSTSTYERTPALRRQARTG